MGSLIEVRVPDIGDFKDVEIIEVAVQPGDAVAAEATLITLETEKATMDVPSTATGVVREIKVSRGGKVSQGDLIALIETEASGSAAESARAEGAAEVPSPPPAAQATSEGRSSTAPVASPARAAQSALRPPPEAVVADRERRDAVVDEPGFARSHASPSIRRFARELGVDLARVEGSGAKGRITEQDVKSHVKRLLTAPSAPAGASLPRVPAVDHAAFGPIERRPLTRIQKIAGPRLHASWVNVPHVTQFDEADITEMEATRAALKEEAAARGIKLTPLAFVMRACAQALAEFPHFGASLDAEAGELVMKKYLHLGFAADTPGGLVVPVVRDADQMSFAQIEKAISDFGLRARDGKLTMDEMQGGTFTISNGGVYGSLMSSPILNPPQSGILGMHKIQDRPVVVKVQIVVRPMMYLALSYDHRIVDGKGAVTFLVRVKEALEDPRRLLMDL